MELDVLRKHGASIRELARVTGWSRNTVRRYLREGEAASWQGLHRHALMTMIAFAFRSRHLKGRPMDQILDAEYKSSSIKSRRHSAPSPRWRFPTRKARLT